MQTELADALDIGKVALGRLLRRLEMRGLISKTAHKYDRRIRLIEMTAKGEALIDFLYAEAICINERITLNLTIEEIVKVDDVLKRTKSRLAAMVEELNDAGL